MNDARTDAQPVRVCSCDPEQRKLHCLLDAEAPHACRHLDTLLKLATYTELLTRLPAVRPEDTWAKYRVHAPEDGQAIPWPVPTATGDWAPYWMVLVTSQLGQREAFGRWEGSAN